MVRIGVMIEGQNGLTWEYWRQALRLAEDLGFDSVFRSDHFTNPSPPDRASLELWTSLTYAASHTTRIEFGPLVSPITFRHPAVTARMAAAVDDLSGGRLVLGIGAGWQEREHAVFGVPFPPVRQRYTMLQDGLEVVTRLLRSDEAASYTGAAFSLDNAILLPRPIRPGGPRLLVGGNGERRTMPLAAQYADEWNAVYVGPEELGKLEGHFDRLLDAQGRERESVLRSVMVGTIFTRDERTLHDRLASRGRTLKDVQQQGLIAGTPAMWVEQLRAFASAGVQRVMLQWLDLDNLADLEIIAREVLPYV